MFQRGVDVKGLEDALFDKVMYASRVSSTAEGITITLKETKHE